MPLDRLDDSGVPLPVPDVQRTTLSLDVMGRFACNTWDEATASGAFDAIVIGSGMFGGYCAEKLYRYGRRVLVLEAGPFVVPTHVQNLPRAGLNVPAAMPPAWDTGAARELVWGIPWRSNVDFVGQAYCVGGKSVYWGGWCPRLLPDDLASWPAPVASYLKQHYGDLERQIGVDERTDFIQGPLYQRLMDRIGGMIGAVPNLDACEEPPLAVQGQVPASGLFSFDKYSSVTLLLDAIREAAGQPDAQRRLFLVPNAHVTELVVDRPESGRLRPDDTGTVRELRAVVAGKPRTLPVPPGCRIVLACGTIESTRLALVSFPTDLMGRNLMAHVRSNVFVRVRRAALDPTSTLPDELQTGAVLIRGSTARGKFHLQVTASADDGGNSDALLYAMIPDVDQLAAILATQRAGWISLAFRGVSQTFGDTTTPVPAARRWIDLSPYERDEYGIPRAYVQLDLDPTESALADDMDAAIVAVANALANGNAADVEIVGRTRDGLGTTYHEAGTLWMGTDPTTSVTDATGRFHHVSNAYCANQSLFVTVGSVNPVLTGLVLARKVAEAVAGP